MRALRMLLITLGLATGSAHAGTVTLTRNDVSSAPDIEAAILNATNFGTTPGTVVLDGRDGAFVYTGIDTSINLFVSNLTLKGINGARIANCDDGLFLDGTPIENILIEDIRFQCTGNGIDGSIPVPRRNVTVRGNVFQTGLHGIFSFGADNWKIFNNTFQAQGDQGGIVLIDSVSSEVVGNRICASYGVQLTTSILVNAPDNKVIANRIEATTTGIILENFITHSTVALNHIAITGQSGIGILLDAETSNNRVQLNKASIAPGGGLITVEDLGTNNKVSGNRP